MKLAAFVMASLLCASSPAHAHQFVSYFEYGRAELSSGGYRMVRDVAAHARQAPRTRIVINAHMDTAEAAEFSNELSSQRAQAVATELVKLGIDPARIERNGQGVSSLARLTPANTAEPLNRRVTVDFLTHPFPLRLSYSR